jgi:alpha-1,2-mannosyltransferase
MLVMAALLLFNPTQEALILGQVTPLLVLLTAVAVLWAVDRPSRAIPSGLMLGLAAGVKLFPIAMVIPAAMRRQWSVVVAATAGLLGVVIAGMALPYGLQLTAQYSTHVVARLPHPWMPLNLGLSSTLGMALAGVSFEVAVFSAGNPMHFEFPPLIPLPAAAAVLGWAVSLAVAGLGLAGTYRVRHDAVAAWMLWIVSLILAMPLVWGHYFMLLPVALALLWRRAPSEAVWWALLVFSGFALNRFYRPLLYLGVHPALTNLLALGPVLVLWIEGLRRAFAASGAHSDSFRMP